MPPPQRAKTARKSARCGVGEGSPRPHLPHPQPVGSGARLHSPKDGRSGLGERPTPDAPHPGKRRPPWGALVSPPQRAKRARKSARCGVGDGFARPHPAHAQPVGSGPWPHAPKDGRLGVGERPAPDAPHPGKRRPPRGALVPPPQRAKPARQSAHCGVGEGSPRTHPPHPQPVGSGPRPHPPKNGRSGVGERPTPDAPHPGKRRPLRGALVPPPQRAKPACKSGRCGVGEGTPRPQPPHRQPVGSRPRPHAPKDGRLRLGERPTPDAPHPGKRRPPRGALVPPPQRAKPACKSARCGVGDGSPRPQAPHPGPIGSGPRPQAPKDWRSGVGEHPIPDAKARGAPPPGTLMPPPQRAKPARKSARGGVGDASPCPHSPHRQPVGSGPRPHAQKDEWSGPGERATPDAPHPGTKRPPRAPSSRPHSALSQLARAQPCGVADGSPRPHPPHPKPVGSGPRPHAQKDYLSGVGERPTPDAPYPGKRRLPRARACRPHSAQSQLPRARAVVLVMGPHARTPRMHSQWVVGPGRTPQRTGHLGCESARPRTPHTQARGALPGAPLCPPHSAQSQHPRARVVGLVKGPHARTPRTHSQWVVGPGRTPRRTGGWGWESARPWTPHTKARGAPPGAPLCRPHSAQSQLAEARAVQLVKGPHARSPRTHSQWVVGPGRTPHRTGSQGWQSAQSRTPRQEAPPPGHAHAAPTARKASSQERAWWGW